MGSWTFPNRHWPGIALLDLAIWIITTPGLLTKPTNAQVIKSFVSFSPRHGEVSRPVLSQPAVQASRHVSGKARSRG